MSYLAARNLKNNFLWSLNLDQCNAQQYILNISSKVRLQYFSRSGKIKKQAHFCINFKKF